MINQVQNLSNTDLARPMFRRVGNQLIWALLTFFMMTSVFSLHPVGSASMEPTIRTNSLVIGWRLSCLTGTAKIERGEIIVFSSPEDQRLLIKRVIGIEGDEIEIRAGNIYLNGTLLQEGYLLSSGKTEAAGSGYTKYSVPEGCVFVLGDNRENSRDSRFLTAPYIPIGQIYSQSLVHFAIPFWICSAFSA